MHDVDVHVVGAVDLDIAISVELDDDLRIGESISVGDYGVLW
jgi:hypothetical protein